MAENGNQTPEEIEQNKERLKEEKKKLKEEQKAQKKEAKKRAKEIAAQEDELDDEIEGSGAPVLLVTLIIVSLWIAILALLVKLDVGGFGSGVLAPVLKNVPVINKILPTEKMPSSSSDAPSSDYDEVYGRYGSIQEAVDQIRTLELELELAQSSQQSDSKKVEEMEAEIERLRTFENNQIAFEKIKNQFYNEVVYADKGPGADEYIKYYESMDPTTAQEIYREVITKKAVDSKVKEYATAYSEMKPKEAAKIFEAMQDDLQLAAKILWEMDVTSRGKILGAMDAEVAARITKIMEPES